MQFCFPIESTISSGFPVISNNDLSLLAKLENFSGLRMRGEQVRRGPPLREAVHSGPDPRLSPLVTSAEEQVAEDRVTAGRGASCPRSERPAAPGPLAHLLDWPPALWWLWGAATSVPRSSGVALLAPLEVNSVCGSRQCYASASRVTPRSGDSDENRPARGTPLCPHDAWGETSAWPS